jgi:toxin ParE1/3/4
VKRILWSKQASDQLADAYDFVVEDNPSAAEKQLEMILRAVEQLVDFPKMGRPGRVNGTRELVIPGTAYIVAYRLHDATVRILALLHGARRWPTHL